jgi:alpha-L-rhamnosidase-like protein
LSWTLDAATTYYRNTGDTAFARQILPWLEGKLAYDATLAGTDGLIVTGPQISTTNSRSNPGHQTSTVSPHPGSLRWTEGTVPTPYGQILVRWTRDGHRFSLTVAVPARSTAFIRLPGRHVILPGGQRGTTRTFIS